MEDNSKTTNGIYDNSRKPSEEIIDGLEFMLDQAVRFVAKLSDLVISADTTLTTKAINGKNNVVRYNGVRATSVDLQKLVKETEDWHAVIETMKQGKDIHRVENCKSHKLEIVGNRGYNEFGQYLVDKTCSSDSDGKDYIEKITSHDD